MSKARELANLGNAYSDGALSSRNLIINGAMQVAQRGTSAAGVTSGGLNSVDRFRYVGSDDATWTYSQDSDAPEGFSNSYKALVTTVDATNDAADYAFIRQSIEGQNLQHIKKGTSDAADLTLSFWVKCSNAGTFISELNDADNNRTISRSYTINSANTWEYKTVTFEGDTSGALDNDNQESLRVHWWYGAGTDYASGTLATSWQSRTNVNRAVGQVNIPTISGGYFQITGVQLEVGDTATPFEHRSYGDELARCQRYFCSSFSDGVTPAEGLGGSNDFANHVAAYNATDAWLSSVTFPTPMRAAPSMTVYRSNAITTDGRIAYFDGGWAAAASNAAHLTDGKSFSFFLSGTFTAKQVYLGVFSWTADAEL